jgi:hypothetical protein
MFKIFLVAKMKYGVKILKTILSPRMKKLKIFYDAKIKY